MKPSATTWWAAALGLPVWLGVGGVLAQAAAMGWQSAGWQNLWQDPQTWPALALTLWTGTAATVLSLLVAAVLLRLVFPGPAWPRWLARLPGLLAVPHAAFAIGLAFLIAPSGWLLRLLSPWATGWDAPPPWPTTQDPWGLGLIAVLVAKEVPFLLWVAAGQLLRPDQAERWSREWQLARSLGHSSGSAWWRVVAPQLLRHWAGPALAVLAYGLTVVDMALVIGPTQPPTLAVLAWQWLLDADPTRNTQGAAAAWVQAALVAALALVAMWLLRTHAWQAAWRRWCTQGPRPAPRPKGAAFHWWMPPRRLIAPLGWGSMLALYAVVGLVLLLNSVAGWWPFPLGWPAQFSGSAWSSILHPTNDAHALWTTLALALASATTALLWAMAWLECIPTTSQWNTALRHTLWLTLALPGVLWALGQHHLSLAWGWDLHVSGLWLAHSLAALPYVLLALTPAYQNHDARYQPLCASLGRTQSEFLWRIKWPMLKAALAGAWAIGFAVSVAQYLPTVLIGGGRFSTLTTEALAHTAGGQRALAAAYAGLLWLLPMLAFTWAAWVGRPRRFLPTQSRQAHFATPQP